MLESLVCERWGGWGWAPGPRGVWCSFVMQKTQKQRNRPTTGTDPRRTPEPTHGTHPRNPPTRPAFDQQVPGPGPLQFRGACLYYI